MSEPSSAVSGELHPLGFIAYRCLKQVGAGIELVLFNEHPFISGALLSVLSKGIL